MKTKFFKLAREAALRADYIGPKSSPKIGAVAVFKGAVLAEAWNTNKTSPLQQKYNKYRFKNIQAYPAKMHCETALISRLTNVCGPDFPWHKIDIYIYREYKDGNLADSAPCASCYQLLKDYGIKHIYYTTKNGFAYEEFKGVQYDFC